MNREVRNGVTYYTTPWPEDGDTQSVLDELIESGVPGEPDQKVVRIEVALPRATRQDDGEGGYLLEIAIPGDDQVVVEEAYAPAAAAASAPPVGS